MAENKKSFLLYCDIIHTINRLSDEQAGILFKHILAYVNDENPTSTDALINIAFEPIKQSLKRDLKKYESIKKSRRKSGRLGGLKSAETRRKKSSKTKQTKQMLKNRSKTKQNQANQPVSVSDSDIDVNVYMYFKQQIAGNEHDLWRENLYMKFRVRNGSMAPLMDEFIIHLGISEKQHSDIGEFKTHFYNWLLGKQSRGELDKYIPGQRKKGDL